MTAHETPPVTDWATDFDHTHPDWAARAHEIWDDLRERCPVAHSDRFGGTWLPTRHADIADIARDTEHFSSVGVVVSDFRPDIPPPVGFAPPITSDPPFHAEARRLLLPAFGPKPIAALEPSAREFCRELLDELVRDGAATVDGAVGYAQHIPVRLIAHMLGVPPDDGDKFRVFIHNILETPGRDDDVPVDQTLDHYLDAMIADHRANPRDDLIGFLVDAEADGAPLSDEHVRGTVALLLIAGIDTTWSAIGASLWHLAQHPEDRRRLVEEPELLPFAVEELLRAYAPVTMARLVATDTELGGRRLEAGDWVLLPFPAGNRDPEEFDDADEVRLDRAQNRHAAFGLGIHRCLGSNLARMELTVAIDEWMRRIPDFELADPAAVRWSAGQIRGPRALPLRIITS
ncbi:MAG: cytochrome P450 [Acidimicrobiia bacterium]|nr:cytochrome P450 [Acidimicrobiia bacterium]